MSDFYRYRADLDVHVVDCGGRVDLEIGVARLRVLEEQLALHSSKPNPKRLLIDFRNTVWVSEDVHMQLSSLVRRQFGLNPENETIRAAVLNDRWSGALAHNEHWFHSEVEALQWLVEAS